MFFERLNQTIENTERLTLRFLHFIKKQYEYGHLARYGIPKLIYNKKMK